MRRESKRVTIWRRSLSALPPVRLVVAAPGGPFRLPGRPSTGCEISYQFLIRSQYGATGDFYKNRIVFGATSGYSSYTDAPFLVSSGALAHEPGVRHGQEEIGAGQDARDADTAS